eukprot:148409_1
MGNQLQTFLNSEESELHSLIAQCERAIIDACKQYKFPNQSLKSVPAAIIDIILQFSEHWKWNTFVPIWSVTERRKSKYLRAYDIQQLRLELRKGNNTGAVGYTKFRSKSALKETHFNRFESPLDTNRRKITFTLNFFRYVETCSATYCPVVEGFVRIGFVSNMYSESRSLYKQHANNQGFDGVLSNGHCFVGLSSRAVYSEGMYGLYIMDASHEQAHLLKDDTPIQYDEWIEICVDMDARRATFKRLHSRGDDGQPKQYELHFPRPVKRFKKEEWYPMVSINPYKSRFYETGCQISRGMIL